MNFLKPFLVEDPEASSPEESSLTFPESSFSGGLCHLQRLIPCLNATSSNAHGGSAEAATISTASEFNNPAIQDLDDDAVTRKVRGTEKEIWVGRIHSIGTDLQGECCRKHCTQEFLTIGGVKLLRLANLNRSGPSRRTFARLCIRSMLRNGSEEVIPNIILFKIE